MVYAWIGAALVGLSLGLLGSGGSILTVPVLVYLAGEPAKVAIAESLAIVGTIALVGALPYAVQRRVDWRSAALFGGGGLVGTFAGASVAAFVPAAVQLVVFAVVMLAASASMFRGRPEPAGERVLVRPVRLLVQGLGVGVVTGLVGVGGGFLIVPALVVLVGLPMRDAVGTSLVVIAANSAVGFVKYLSVLDAGGLSVDLHLVVVFAGIGVAGSLVGNAVSGKVPQASLRRGFAVLLVAMGAFILWREVPRVLAPAPPDVASASEGYEELADAGFAAEP